MTKEKKGYWIRLNKTYEKDGQIKQVVMLATDIPETTPDGNFIKFYTKNRETGEEEFHMLPAKTKDGSSIIEEVNQAKEEDL